MNHMGSEACNYQVAAPSKTVLWNPLVSDPLSAQYLQMNILVLSPTPKTSSSLAASDFHKWVVVDADSLPDDNPAAAHLFLHRVCSRYRPLLVISLGSYDVWAKRHVSTMPFPFRRIWLHWDTMPAPGEVTMAVLASQAQSEDVPLISVVTPAYRSGDKIQRAYQSLLAQSYENWEWVLWDDSPDDKTFQMLQSMAADDMRLVVSYIQPLST